jgi:hypothetical protein
MIGTSPRIISKKLCSKTQSYTWQFFGQTANRKVYIRRRARRVRERRERGEREQGLFSNPTIRRSVRNRKEILTK